jgi:hypothetical protein
MATRADPGGHCFAFLNVSINKTLIFFSEVVTYKKGFSAASAVRYKRRRGHLREPP